MSISDVFDSNTSVLSSKLTFLLHNFLSKVELVIFSSFDISNQNINMVIYGKDTETNRRAKRPTYTYNVKCM